MKKKRNIKRIVFLLCIVLLYVYQTNAQVPTLNGAVQVWADFDRERGQLTLNTRNIDFCDYYVRIFFLDVDGFEGMSYDQGLSATVGRGKRQIRIYKARAGATRHVYRYNYRIYRGNSAKKPNVDFVYALPVVAGDTVRAMVVKNREYYQIVFDLPSDTIYTCRGGVMCDDKLGSYPVGMSQITLYHDDGSFSEYVFKGKSLASPGQRIKMGSPIAIVRKNPDKRPVRLIAPGDTLEIGPPIDVFEGNPNKYSIRFSTYFLDKSKLTTNLPFPFNNKYTYFLPFFQISNSGKAQLKSEEIYTCELTDEMQMQEMSKREKKKFLKMKANEKDYKK